MKYYLVGDPGLDVLVAGKTTIIRKRRTASGDEWSYLYRVSLEDDAWQKEQAPEPADATKRLFWGRWMNWDMVQAGGYPSVQGISETKVAELVEAAGPCPFCGHAEITKA